MSKRYVVWYCSPGGTQTKTFLSYRPDTCSFYTSLPHATAFATRMEALVHVPVYDGSANIEKRTGVIAVDSKEFKPRPDTMMASTPGWRSKDERLPLLPGTWIAFVTVTLMALILMGSFLCFVYGQQWWGELLLRAGLGVPFGAIAFYSLGRFWP